MDGGIAEPRARGRHVAAGPLADIGNEFLDMRHAGLLPVPFEHPVAEQRFRRQALIDFQLLLGAGDMDFLIEAELHRLLEAVDHVVAGQEQDQRVRIGRLRLDQIGREVGGAERRVVGAELGAVGGFQARFEALPAASGRRRNRS